MTRLHDTHCHLDDPKYAGEFDLVLARAADAGVVRMTTIGCVRSHENIDSALQIARRAPERLSATIGVHPHDAIAAHEDDTLLVRVRELAEDPTVVAVGEMGLDYHYDRAPRDVQQSIFRQQIALAREVAKPIIIHTREARQDTLAILQEESARDVGGIIHCFSEDAAFASAALDLGFIASFSGIVTFKNATAIRDAAARQPADAILVETDAPYLAPVPYRGKRNEPAYVHHTATVVAELRGDDFDALCEATTANAARLFGLPAL